jgi:hypothetical protein
MSSIIGCGTIKDKTAPCKRPAILTSFVDDPRTNCEPMSLINGDSGKAFAAIEAMQAEWIGGAR